MDFRGEALPGILLAVSVGVILVLVILAKYKADVRALDDDLDEGTYEAAVASAVPPRSRAVPVLSAVVVILLFATVALGYLLWDLRRDFDNVQSDLDHKVEEAEGRLTVLVAKAVNEVPDVDAVRQDVEQLEEALFGFAGAPVAANDELGELRKDLGDALRLMQQSAALSGDYATTACVNSGFQSLQNYAARVAGYAGIVASGGFAARPYAPNPRCY